MNEQTQTELIEQLRKMNSNLDALVDMLRILIDYQLSE